MNQLDDAPDMMPVPPRNRDDDSPSNPEDELYRCYGVRPNLPIRTKVEHLHLIYRLPVDQIATLIGVSAQLVIDEIEELKNDWREMGKPLSIDDRELERGRLIASLDRLIQQIDDQLVTVGAAGESNRLLTLKLNALDRRSKLLGLEYDKNQTAAQESAEASLLETVEQKLDAIPAEQLEKMMAMLDGDIAHFSSGDLPESGDSSSSSEDDPALSVLANEMCGIEEKSSSSSESPGDWAAELD